MENSRFKFRVWDKGNEQYLNLSEVDYLTLDTENGGLIIGFLDELMTEMTYMPEKDMVIEQCTGLKDKNGNLIYEGDIIRFCVKRRGYILTYERIVVWDKDKCSFVVRNAEDQAAPLAKWKMPHPDTHIIEIIGNTHKQAE